MSSQIKTSAVVLLALLAISATVTPSGAQTRVNRNDQSQSSTLLQRIDKERGFAGERQMGRTY